jgi:hypothetical protein
MCFRILPAHDDQIFVNRSRRGELNRLRLVRLAQTFAQVDVAVLPEAWDQLAGGRVQGKDVLANGGEDAALMAIGPVGDAARPGDAASRAMTPWLGVRV